MPKIVKQLAASEVKYGLLYISSEPRDLLPESSASVTVIDSDGERFDSKMHSRGQSRIDGLTKLHRKHSSQAGDVVTIEVDPSDKATAHVRFEKSPVESHEIHQSSVRC